MGGGSPHPVHPAGGQALAAGAAYSYLILFPFYNTGRRHSLESWWEVGEKGWRGEWKWGRGRILGTVPHWTSGGSGWRKLPLFNRWLLFKCLLGQIISMIQIYRFDNSAIVENCDDWAGSYKSWGVGDKTRLSILLTIPDLTAEPGLLKFPLQPPQPPQQQQKLQQQYQTHNPK